MATNQVSPLISGADLTGKVPLDSGTFGLDVFLCHHKTHGQLLVKTVCTARLHNKSKRRSLLEEVEPLLMLNHSRIVRVLGVVLEGGPSYLVMQFFPKGHLLAILNEVTVPISIKGRIMLDILEGMVYLTNCGIVHKDLKPQNILVDEDFHIKIADLGLASCRSWSKLTMDESYRQSRKGVPCRAVSLFYLAPEHLHNIHQPFTHKSDVYSFAIIVWVILTDKEPYSHFQEDQVAAAVCSGARPEEGLIPRHAPMEMVALMKKCWLHDPDRRPTFAESYTHFQHFYRDQLEKKAERDLKSLTGQHESPDLTAGMSAFSLNEPHWQSDAPSSSVGVPAEASVEVPRTQDGLWLRTDALPEGRDCAPHGSFIVSPDPGQRPCPRPASCSPQPWRGEDPPLPGVTMRERKSGGTGRAEAHRSWPVFPDQGPHSRGAGADSSGLMHRQCSVGVFIQNAIGVQFGDNNHLDMGLEGSDEDGFQPSPSDISPYEGLLQKYEDRAVRKEQLELLSKNIGQNWKCCARRLGLTNVEVEGIGYDFGREGLDEMVHQMLQKWQMKAGIVGCTVGGLCRALRDHVSMDVLLQLLQRCQGGATP